MAKKFTKKSNDVCGQIEKSRTRFIRKIFLLASHKMKILKKRLFKNIGGRVEDAGKQPRQFYYNNWIVTRLVYKSDILGVTILGSQKCSSERFVYVLPSPQFHGLSLNMQNVKEVQFMVNNLRLQQYYQNKTVLTWYIEFYH